MSLSLEEKNESKQIAQTILDQLGGHQFAVITDSKNFFCDGPQLFMTLARNNSGANKLRIKLEEDDTYRMVFTYVTKNYTQVRAEYAGVYCDQLRDIFEKTTKLYTRF